MEPELNNIVHITQLENEINLLKLQIDSNQSMKTTNSNTNIIIWASQCTFSLLMKLYKHRFSFECHNEIQTGNLIKECSEFSSTLRESSHKALSQAQSETGYHNNYSTTSNRAELIRSEENMITECFTCRYSAFVATIEVAKTIENNVILPMKTTVSAMSAVLKETLDAFNRSVQGVYLVLRKNGFNHIVDAIEPLSLSQACHAFTRMEPSDEIAKQGVVLLCYIHDKYSHTESYGQSMISQFINRACKEAIDMLTCTIERIRARENRQVFQIFQKYENETFKLKEKMNRFQNNKNSSLVYESYLRAMYAEHLSKYLSQLADFIDSNTITY